MNSKLHAAGQAVEQDIKWTKGGARKASTGCAQIIIFHVVL